MDKIEIQTLIKQYEDNMLLNQLSRVCHEVTHSEFFRAFWPIVYNKYYSGEIRDRNYPDFIRERMGWRTGSQTNT